jgi:hypothetical protein
MIRMPKRDPSEWNEHDHLMYAYIQLHEAAAREKRLWSCFQEYVWRLTHGGVTAKAREYQGRARLEGLARCLGVREDGTIRPRWHGKPKP